jgi:hypothetical protein
MLTRIPLDPIVSKSSVGLKILTAVTEHFCLLGCNAVQFLLAACLLTVTLAYSSTLKMEAVRSSEGSENFYRTTPRQIPEDSTLGGLYL